MDRAICFRLRLRNTFDVLHPFGDSAVAFCISLGAGLGDAEHSLRHVRANPLPICRFGLHPLEDLAESLKLRGVHFCLPKFNGVKLYVV